MGNAVRRPRCDDPEYNGIVSKDGSSRPRGLTASDCIQLHARGGRQLLHTALLSSPQSVSKRAFYTHDTLVHELARAGAEDVLKVGHRDRTE